MRKIKLLHHKPENCGRKKQAASIYYLPIYWSSTHLSSSYIFGCFYLKNRQGSGAGRSGWGKRKAAKGPFFLAGKSVPSLPSRLHSLGRIAVCSSKDVSVCYGLRRQYAFHIYSPRKDWFLEDLLVTSFQTHFLTCLDFFVVKLRLCPSWIL